MEKKRKNKINSLLMNILHKEISLLNNKLLSKSLISILECKITEDCSYAYIYVSIFNLNIDKKKIFNALKKSSLYLRYMISNKLKVRNIPMIIFKLDNSIDNQFHINKVIKKCNDSK